MRWSGPWKTDRLLKTAMVLTGTVLVLALAKPLAGETMKMVLQHSKIPWKMAAAEFLADFLRFFCAISITSLIIILPR